MTQRICCHYCGVSLVGVKDDLMPLCPECAQEDVPVLVLGGRDDPLTQAIIEAAGQKAFGASPAERRATGVCVMCGNPPPADMSELGQREYSISGTCEPCFDRMFPEEPEEEGRA